MSSSLRFLLIESRRLLVHPVLWVGALACAATVVWWWHDKRLRVPPIKTTGAFVSMGLEGSLALVAMAVAVVLGLLGAGGFDALGRTPYLQVRGVKAGARSFATTVGPAAAAFLAVLLGQLLAWAFAPRLLKAGTTELPSSVGPPPPSWQAWMQPPLPPGSPAWLPDLVSIVAFAAVVAGIAAIAGALLRLVGSAWIAGILTFIGATVSEVGVEVVGLPQQLAPWWALTHRSPWLLEIVLGAAIVLVATLITYGCEKRKDNA